MNRRQFGAGLLGAAGAIAINRSAIARPSSVRVNTDAAKTQVRFTFAGLMVFRQDRDIFELGVLRARKLSGGMPDHIFRINRYPDGEHSSPIDPDLLESYVLGGDVAWTIEVRDAQGKPLRGVKANIGIPSDRHNPSSTNPRDFGWMINLEGPEFHGKKLDRAKDKLKPVISLNYGTLETACKTGVIDVKKGLGAFREFGFITGGGALTIDTSNNEVVVLRTQQQADILKLETGKSYDVEILNTPPRNRPVPMGGHFGLYYDLLFDVGKFSRFKIQAHPKGRHPDDDCAKEFQRDPDPYKCGGILINEASGPLGG